MVPGVQTPTEPLAGSIRQLVLRSKLAEQEGLPDEKGRVSPEQNDMADKGCAR